MQRTSRHHVVPISIGGWDCEENIVFLTPAEHTELHKLMNISYESIRTFRKRTNHIIFVNEYYVRELAMVQEVFFKNLHKLNSFMIEQIATSLYRLVRKMIRDYQIEKFHVATSFDTDLSKARYMLKSYHALYLIVVLRKTRT